MIKKCVVKYDELGKPIEVVEIKDFNDPQTLKLFKEKCDANKVEYLKRQEEIRRKAQEEKDLVQLQIKSLGNEISLLKSVISHILGYEELSEVEICQILGVLPPIVQENAEEQLIEEPIENPIVEEE